MAPIAEGSAWGVLSFLCVWAWRLCLADAGGGGGDAGRGELCGSSSAGGLRMEALELIICVVLSGLSLLRWFHLPTSAWVAALSPSEVNVGARKKCSLFLRPLTNPKVGVRTLTEPKKR